MGTLAIYVPQQELPFLPRQLETTKWNQQCCQNNDAEKERPQNIEKAARVLLINHLPLLNASSMAVILHLAAPASTVWLCLLSLITL